MGSKGENVNASLKKNETNKNPKPKVAGNNKSVQSSLTIADAKRAKAVKSMQVDNKKNKTKSISKNDFLPLAVRQVGEFKLTSTIVEVSADDKIGKVFGLLQKYNLLSVPVYDFKKNEYLGFIDVFDLMILVFKVDEYVMDLEDHELNEKMVKEIVTVGYQNNKIGSESPCRILFEKGVCPSYPFLPVTAQSEMSQVLKSLNHVTKRVPVINPDTGRITQIMSQSAVINMVNRRIMKLEKDGWSIPEEFMKTTKDLGYHKDVVWLSDDKSLEEAFRVMIYHCRSTIAIKDDDGKILTTVTTRDILHFKDLQEVGDQRFKYEQYRRAVKAGKIQKGTNNPTSYINMTAGDFVAKVKQKDIKSDKPAVITAPASANLRDIISKLAKTKIHRLFIVDQKRRPVGIVSVKDVIRSLLDMKLLGNDPAKGYSARLVL